MNDFPGRLTHHTPGWVKDGALFHIRVRTAAEQSPSLIDPTLGKALLNAVQQYHDSGKWYCELFLLMPDHWHALLAFPPEPGMISTIRDWKRATARMHQVRWQENFFDHRLRHHKETSEKRAYIRRNPVASGLCPDESEWPWTWSLFVG